MLNVQPDWSNRWNSRTFPKNIAQQTQYDISNDLEKNPLYKQFVAWHANGCSMAPLTDFASNLIFQELKDKSEYFGDDSDEKVYIDLCDSRDYTNKLDKPSHNDLKMTINIELFLHQHSPVDCSG